jgi:hypothetical protein
MSLHSMEVVNRLTTVRFLSSDYVITSHVELFKDFFFFSPLSYVCSKFNSPPNLFISTFLIVSRLAKILRFVFSSLSSPLLRDTHPHTHTLSLSLSHSLTHSFTHSHTYTHIYIYIYIHTYVYIYIYIIYIAHASFAVYIMKISLTIIT